MRGKGLIRFSLKVYHTLTENQNSYGWFKCSFRFSSMFCYMRLIKVRQRVVCLQTTATTHNIYSRAVGRSENSGVVGEYFVMCPLLIRVGLTSLLKYEVGVSAPLSLHPHIPGFRQSCICSNWTWGTSSNDVFFI